jgi:hypothetical protein
VSYIERWPGRPEACICPEVTFTSGPTAEQVEACRTRSPWLHVTSGQMRDLWGDLAKVPPPADTACGCVVREDFDGERIATHCAGHCPRVLAGDWSECRGC